MARLMKSSVLTAVILCAAASPATAQTPSGSILAKANVLTALVVTPGTDLDFGLVIQGVNKTVDPAAPASGTTSGKFSIAGQASQSVSVTFTALPANLTGPSSATMPITYTGIRNTTNSPSGGVAFTPSTGIASTPLSGTGDLYLFLGGTVSPGTSQSAGSYQATVTMQVAYIGY